MGSRAGRNYRETKADSKNENSIAERETEGQRRKSKLVIGGKIGHIQRAKKENRY